MKSEDSTQTFPHEYEAAKGRMCFLCGSTENLTDEHIFPTWLLRRYDSWKERLPLLNGRSSKFEKLRLRACLECNRDHLGKQLEDKISVATEKGYDAVKALDERIIFLWTAKIYLALKFKELTMQAVPGESSHKTIWNPKDLESDSLTHIILDSVRGTTEILDPVPYSVLVVNLHESDSLPSFSHYDRVLHKTIAIQVGTVGFIVALEDFGINRYFYGHYLDKAEEKKLSFTQYIELFARVSYQSSLISGHSTSWPVMLPEAPDTMFLYVDGSSVKFNPWKQIEYMRHFQRSLEESGVLEDSKFEMSKRGGVPSYLFDNKNNMMFLDNESDKVTYIPPPARAWVYPARDLTQQVQQAQEIVTKRRV